MEQVVRDALGSRSGDGARAAVELLPALSQWARDKGRDRDRDRDGVGLVLGHLFCVCEMARAHSGSQGEQTSTQGLDEV